MSAIVRDKSRGMALLLVLWLVAALSLYAATGSDGVRKVISRVGDEASRVKATMVLDGALTIVCDKLTKEQAPVASYRFAKLSMGEEQVWVEVIPASGLVDPTVAKVELMAALLERVGGMSADQARIMTTRIKDFIDPDDIPGEPGGAEMGQYKTAGRTVMPRNSALQDVTELLDVLGMDATVYEKISPYLTLRGSNALDPKAVPPDLVDILTGSQGAVREAKSNVQRIQDLSGDALSYFQPGSAGGGSQVRLRVFTAAGQGFWWVRESTVDLRKKPDQQLPWSTLTTETLKRVKIENPTLSQ